MLTFPLKQRLNENEDRFMDHTSSTWRQHATRHRPLRVQLPTPECLTADGVCLLDVAMEARVRPVSDKNIEQGRKRRWWDFENKSAT